MLSQSAANAVALARNVGAQSCDRAAIRAIGAVAFGQVLGLEIGQIGVAALFLDAALERARDRFGGEVVLRSEMAVEAAMREAGAVHDCVDANAIEAFLAKKPRSGVDDPLSILGRLIPADPHLHLQIAP